MADERPHLSPKFEGPRFAHHSIPLELLSDLAAYRDLVKEVAKSLYKAEHPEKKRVPSAFEATFKLSLKEIGEGSAVAALVNDVDTQEDADIIQFTPYFNRAKSVVDETIRSGAVDGGTAPKEFPTRLLTNFGRIGKNLKQGEIIDFGFGKANAAPFTAAVRKTLVLRGSDEVESAIDEIGIVTGIQKDGDNVFDFKTDEGKTVSASFYPHLEEDIFEALKENAKKALRLKGHGIFNKQNRLLRISEVKEIEVLDDDDLGFIRAFKRVEEMTKLPAGWCDGQGGPLSTNAVAWFGDLLKAFNDVDIPPPYVYPTPHGEVQMEWEWPGQSVDLRLNFGTKSSQVFAVVDGKEMELAGNLSAPADMEKLMAFLLKVTPESDPKE